MFSDRWSVRLELGLQDGSTDSGTERNFLADGSTSLGTFNEANGFSFSIMAGITFHL